MADKIQFHESPDGTVKQLICLEGVDYPEGVWNFFRTMVEGAAFKGRYLAHIDNSREISNETGGNPGWGMTIENKRGEVALLTFKRNNESKLREALCAVVGANTRKEWVAMLEMCSNMPGEDDVRLPAINALKILIELYPE